MALLRHPDISGRAPERRLHHRALVSAPAWLLVEGERHDAQCIDLSMGGAAIHTQAHVATGAVVWLELCVFADRGSISIRCEAVRASERELGLRFLSLDRRSLEAILALV